MTGDAIYAHVEPDPLVFDAHHNPPESWWKHTHPGEPYPAKWPLLELAPSTHRKLHVAIDAIVKAGGPQYVSAADVRRFGKVYRIAAQGYITAVEAGLIPKPTLLAR